MMKRSVYRFPLIVLLASLAIIFALRYIVVIQHIDMGSDMAGYLATMNKVFGNDPGGFGLFRPPLIALPLKLLTIIFGTLTGAKILGVLVSVAIGIPFYLIAKRLCTYRIAVVSSILFVLSTPYVNMLGWGYITMIGIFCVLLSLHFFLLVLDEPSKRNIILASISVSLLVGFHQLSLVFFILLMGIFIITLLLFNRERFLKRYKSVLAIIAVSIVFSIPYIPTYINILRAQPEEHNSSVVSSTPLIQIETHLETRFGLSIWPTGIAGAILTLALVIIALKWLWGKDRNSTLLLAVMFFFPLLLMVFILPSPFSELSARAHYFLCIPIWLLVGVFFTRIWLFNKYRLLKQGNYLAKVAILIVVFALLIGGMTISQKELQSSVDFYNNIDESRWEAVEWIAENTNPEDIVAVYPTSLGWWIGGVAIRDTFLRAERDAVVLKIDYERSLATDRILSRNQGLENGNVRLATPYPYNNAPGNPVLGAFIGGLYQDILMLDNCANYFKIEGIGTIPLSDTSKETITEINSEFGQIITSYRIGDIEIIQTITLKQLESEATISYKIHCDNTNVTAINIPIYFCRQPISVSNELNPDSFLVIQEINTPKEGIVPVTTKVSVETSDVTLTEMKIHEDWVTASFNNALNEATIDIRFNIINPQFTRNDPVSHYSVPELINDWSIDYIVLDLNPISSVFNDIPEGTEEWLNNSPYYELVFSWGDVRIYRICPDYATLQ